jgi:hypothetical protein
MAATRISAFVKQLSKEDLREIANERDKAELAERYQIQKLKNHIQPLLDYLKFKDTAEAQAKLFKEEKKDQPASEPPAASPSTSFTTSVYNTALSCVGITTNQEKAEDALKIILRTVEESKKSDAIEPVLVVDALKCLANIYRGLPQRSSYSVANLFYEPPRLLTALGAIFKDFNVENLEALKLERFAFYVFKSFNRKA